MEEVESKDLVNGAIKGMLSTLDPHTTFMNPEMYKELLVETKGRFGGLGIEITIKDGVLTVVSPIEDTPAFRAGIKAGDKIIKIGDETTKDMNIFEAVKRMRGEKGTQVTITIMRNEFEEPKDFTITRAIISVKSVRYKMVDEQFGYIKVRNFQQKTGKEVKKALTKLSTENKDMIGLILDVRNNPGGPLNQAVEVSDAFLKSGLIVSIQGRVEDHRIKFSADDGGDEPRYPIVVITNGGTASAAEIVAGALQDHKRAVIIGTQTFGKGTVQTIYPLEDGSALKLTTALYYTPSGKSIQAEGIIPDILVSETMADEPSKNIRFLREKDLKHHISGENEDISSEEKVSEDTKEEEKQDVQLERAIEILKGWEIFKTSDVLK